MFKEEQYDIIEKSQYDTYISSDHHETKDSLANTPK
jgi:hypothetical protein